jgi:hypothetical protein
VPPELPGSVGDDQVQVGWVRLPGRLLHRAYPITPDRVVCGKPLPVGVKVYARPPADWPPYKTCASTLPLRLATGRKRGFAQHRPGGQGPQEGPACPAAG